MAAHHVLAQDLRVVKGGAAGNKASLDLSGMKATGPGGALFVQTLESDLKRSGWFTVTRAGGGIRVQGTCGDSGGDVAVQCDVRNAGSPESYLTRSYKDSSAKARRLAHQVADDIVWALKHVKGIASTRIAMVGSRGGGKDLYLCDYDGGNLVQVTRDKVPCLSPAWGPDGTFLTYTSFRSGYPDVYRIDLDSLRRGRIAGFPGLNANADVSPNGRSIALTLSKDGNPDLYVMGLGGGAPTRVTRTSHAAEASPSWSPDGSQIAYVSDRARSPQLYIMSSAGAGERRITLEGSENVSPDWGPAGRIVYSSRRGGQYQLCVFDAGSGRSEQITTDGFDHEDPSWAPDGRHIVYMRTSAYRKSLYILDTQGDPEVRLTPSEGDWSSPAWSPR
jgi:TolB protein